MSPRTEKQLDDIRKKRRADIMKIALKSFARRGFVETTTADIASRAGISKGLIYNYFRSKEEIVECLITEAFRDALPSLMSGDDTRDPRAQLEELIHTWIRLIRSESDLLRLVLQLHTSGAFKGIVQRKAGDVLEMFSTGLIRIFKRLGSSEPEIEATVMGSLFDGVSLNYAADPESFPLEKIEQRLVELYCKPQE